MSSQRLTAAGKTDTGRVRSLNEDAFLLENELELALVADGMGGHGAGDMASNMAVEVVSDFIYEYDPDFIEGAGGGQVTNRSEQPSIAPDVLQAAVNTANNKMYQINCTNNHREGTGMGSTLVGLWLMENEDRAAIFHVGDSRVYLLRGGKLRQCTKDHSVYQEWLDSGREGAPPKRNIISRALGPWPKVEVDVRFHDLAKGDLFLLCTDGLTDMVDDQAIEDILLKQSDPERGCRALVEEANRNGGVDNITAVLARID